MTKTEKNISRRIAMISDHASPLALAGSIDSGGQNIYVAHVARHLARQGHKIDVFTRKDDESLPEIQLWEEGVRIIHVAAGPAEFIRKEELLPHMQEFTEFLREFMVRHDITYDFIHAHSWMSALVAADLKKELGIPFAITFHALGRVRRQYQGVEDGFPDERFQIEDRVIAEADAIIAECPQDEQDLRILYEADPAKIQIIPCGFDPAEVWPMEKSLARRILGLRQDERIILQLGRLVPQKGVDNVIRGFARLVRDYGIKARLLIVGGSSEKPDPRITPEIGRLQEVAREEGVEGYVTFVGRRGRKAIKYLYSAADVFVSTPWYEPFGITPVEAMACGTPVIGSNVGGIRSTVQDGKTGYLIPPDDPDLLAERLADLYGNPVRLRHFGQQSIRRVNELFTWQKVAHSIDRLYEKVLTGDESLEKTETIEQPETVSVVGTVRAGDLTTGFGRTGPLSPAEIETVEQGFKDALDVLRHSRKRLVRPVWQAANAILETLARGGKVMVCGNGGGAAEAQHFAAELLGRFRMNGRPGLPVIALTADTSFLSDWARESSYEDVFARQVQALGRRGDLLIGLGTNGNSPNLLQAFKMAASMGIDTLPFLGGSGGELAELAGLAIVVPDERTPRIQEIQLLALHMICDLIEHHAASRSAQSVPLEPVIASMRGNLKLRPTLAMRMERSK